MPKVISQVEFGEVERDFKDSVTGLEFGVSFECDDDVGKVDFFAAEGEGWRGTEVWGEEVWGLGLLREALDCWFGEEVLYYSCGAST